MSSSTEKQKGKKVSQERWAAAEGSRFRLKAARQQSHSIKSKLNTHTTYMCVCVYCLVGCVCVFTMTREREYPWSNTANDWNNNIKAGGKLNAKTNPPWNPLDIDGIYITITLRLGPFCGLWMCCVLSSFFFSLSRSPFLCTIRFCWLSSLGLSAFCFWCMTRANSARLAHVITTIYIGAPTMARLLYNI